MSTVKMRLRGRTEKELPTGSKREHFGYVCTVQTNGDMIANIPQEDVENQIRSGRFEKVSPEMEMEHDEPEVKYTAESLGNMKRDQLFAIYEDLTGEEARKNSSHGQMVQLILETLAAEGEDV